MEYIEIDAYRGVAHGQKGADAENLIIMDAKVTMFPLTLGEQ